jgi:outer membrane biosynthesis protein TonB
VLAVGVYGGLLVVGFFFGVVAGYEPSKPPPLVASAVKDREPARRDDPKPEGPKPDPKVGAPTAGPEPKAAPTPRVDPPRPEPTPEPKKPDPPKAEPKKEEPKKAEPAATVPVVSFEKDVKPILRTYCFNCHGAAGKPKGDVDLTSLAKITDPNNPPILKPGDPEKSAIYFTIVDMSMPPQGSRPGKGETEVIRNWIAGGAKPRRRKFPRHGPEAGPR